MSGSQMNWQTDLTGGNVIGSQFQSKSQEFMPPMYQPNQGPINFDMDGGDELEPEERDRVIQADLKK